MIEMAAVMTEAAVTSNLQLAHVVAGAKVPARMIAEHSRRKKGTTDGIEEMLLKGKTASGQYDKFSPVVQLQKNSCSLFQFQFFPIKNKK